MPSDTQVSQSIHHSSPSVRRLGSCCLCRQLLSPSPQHTFTHSHPSHPPSIARNIPPSLPAFPPSVPSVPFTIRRLTRLAESLSSPPAPLPITCGHCHKPTTRHHHPPLFHLRPNTSHSALESLSLPPDFCQSSCLALLGPRPRVISPGPAHVLTAAPPHCLPCGSSSSSSVVLTVKSWTAIGYITSSIHFAKHRPGNIHCFPPITQVADHRTRSTSLPSPCINIHALHLPRHPPPPLNKPILHEPTTPEIETLQSAEPLPPSPRAPAPRKSLPLLDRTNLSKTQTLRCND